jgi:hypothetical protein
MESASNPPDHRVDILVTARNGTKRLLVVEVKGRNADPAVLHNGEEQLRRYMKSMRCPVGLLVTTNHIRLLRDEYLTESPASIGVVGDYPTPPPLSRWQDESIWSTRPQPGLAFEEAVQHWLEELSHPFGQEGLSEDLRRAIDEHILPALNQGEVRAAGPRWRHGARSAQ